MTTQIDHLVVVAASLAQGVAWCEATLGITPGPGGAHARYGTHNRLFKVATPALPWAYLEIIAIDPAATPQADAAARRWFDMDDPRLQAAVAEAPRLVHLVANTPDIAQAHAALLALGIERGPVRAASRASPRGLLEWQITVRDDGQRLFDGAVPTLIQWGRPGEADPLRLHPRHQLPRSRVSLRAITVTHPQADRVRAAYAALGLDGVQVLPGPANLRATLQSPKGLVHLDSGGL